MRITYGDKEAGDLFTADDADMIANAVNALGTAADVDTGTSAGNVPIIGGDGLLPSAIIPGGGSGGGGGSGDVSGPGSTTIGRPAIWSNGDGTGLDQGTAAQVMPTSGTTGYVLTFGASAPAWSSLPTLATALEALTTTDRIAYTGIDGLDSAGAGALYGTALAAAGSPTALQIPRWNAAATAIEWVTLGTAAFVDVVPAGAPGSASSTAGAITLDFDGVDELATTTTEAITAITFANITSYATVAWWVTQTTARDITFPAGSIMKGNSGLLLVTGTANSRQLFLIRNAGGTYEVQVGDAGVVGA
jgi:hypothetical protein